MSPTCSIERRSRLEAIRMRSFEHDDLLETPVSHGLLMTIRALGEFRGRQAPYPGQSPEVLQALRCVAVVQIPR